MVNSNVMAKPQKSAATSRRVNVVRLRQWTCRLLCLAAYMQGLCSGAPLLAADDGDDTESADTADTQAPESPAQSPVSTSPASKDAPEINGWIRQTLDKRGSFPRLLAIVKALSDKPGTEPQYLPLSSDAFAKVSYLRLANSANAAWDYKLNRAKYAQNDPLAVVTSLTGADTVLNIPDSGDWEIWQYSGKRRRILHATGPDTQKPAAIAAWLVGVLGWDGVVLEQRGDYLLVGSLTKTLAKPNIQALAVTNSVSKFTLKPKERQGAGLLSLSASQGGIGVFDIVLLGQGVTALPTGTKLLIEKKKD